MKKIGRDFHLRLVKLKNDANHEALYSRYLTELFSNSTQTMYLSANYKIFEMECRSFMKRLGGQSTTMAPPVSIDSYASLLVGGDSYNL
jgi:hypothetical protein